MTRKSRVVQAPSCRSSSPSLKQTWPARKDRDRLIFWPTSAGRIGSIFTSLERTFLLRQRKVFAERWKAIPETFTRTLCCGIGCSKMDFDWRRQKSISRSRLHLAEDALALDSCNSAE